MNALRIEDANVISFPKLTVVNGNAKLTVDGRVKKTHSNAKVGRSTWVDPIREIKDVYRVIDYLQSKIDRETRPDYKRAWARNKLYFCIGVFSGFRVSDLLELKWQDIFESDGKTYKEYVGIIEKKTGKVKQLYTTSASRAYIEEYIQMMRPDTTSNTYLFTNRQGKKLNRQSVDDFIKEAANACGLKGNYSTHSVRKTYAYQYYTIMSAQGDIFALAEVQRMLNHRNTDTTLRYLGIDKEHQQKNMDAFARAMMMAREGGVK